MKDRHVKDAKISEAETRSLVKVFAADVPALTAAALAGLNRNATQRYCDPQRRRIGNLAGKEAGAMAGEVEVDEKLLWGTPRARQTRAGSERKNARDRPAQTRREGLYANRRELLQASAGAHYQGSGALGGHGLYRWLEVP